jgi:hypothetical protein
VATKKARLTAKKQKALAAKVLVVRPKSKDRNLHTLADRSPRIARAFLCGARKFGSYAALVAVVD